MEDRNEYPPIMSQQAQTGTQSAAQAEVLPKPRWQIPSRIKRVAVIFIIILFLGICILFLRSTAPQTTQTTPSSTPTPTAVAAAAREVMPYATESAFLEFESQIDTVSRGIQNAPIDMQMLLPPSLDLPLGFGK